MNNEKKLIRFDWAMKSILKNKSNFDILEGFLTALLGRDITILNIIESESNQDDLLDKYNKVDLLVLDNNGEYIIIEIQNQREVHFLERILYGTSKLIVENMALGDSYEKVKKVISVSILYFIYAENTDDYVYYGTTELKGIHTNKPFKIKRKHKKVLNIIECKDIFPEYYLIEVEKFQNIINNDLDEWIYFLKNEEVQDNFKAKNIHKLKHKLSLLKMKSEDRKKYERYLDLLGREKDLIGGNFEDAWLKGKEQGIKEGKEQGVKEGKEQGIKEGKIETARNFKKMGILSIEQIAEATGLSIEEIEEL